MCCLCFVYDTNLLRCLDGLHLPPIQLVPLLSNKRTWVGLMTLVARVLVIRRPIHHGRGSIVVCCSCCCARGEEIKQFLGGDTWAVDIGDGDFTEECRWSGACDCAIAGAREELEIGIDIAEVRVVGYEVFKTFVHVMKRLGSVKHGVPVTNWGDVWNGICVEWNARRLKAT